MRTRCGIGAVIIVLLFSLCGCSGSMIGTESGRVMEYTLVSREELPEEFAQQIDSAKDQMMKLSYRDDRYLYIAKGYGKLDTGGYSIAVEQLYTSGGSIYLETRLIEPADGEVVSNNPSAPYIVIKVENIDGVVVFL